MKAPSIEQEVDERQARPGRAATKARANPIPFGFKPQKHCPESVATGCARFAIPAPRPELGYDKPEDPWRQRSYTISPHTPVTGHLTRRRIALSASRSQKGEAFIHLDFWLEIGTASPLNTGRSTPARREKEIGLRGRTSWKSPGARGQEACAWPCGSRSGQPRPRVTPGNM